MFRIKISLPIALLLVLLGVGTTLVVTNFVLNKKEIQEQEPGKTIVNCTSDIVRLHGYEFISPLLFTEQECESETMLPIKNEVNQLITGYKNTGIIQSASVYVRKLQKGEWISIGTEEKYNPGSLLKVPELITFMKMNEKDPGLLDRKILYNNAFNLPKRAVYVTKSIELGKSYTYRELLYYMIAYSDNYATMLLNQKMDLELFKKVFTDLGIAEPDLKGTDIPITAKDYSYFMRALYNASYLSIKDSEYCTELLSHSDFASGMMSGIPKTVKVAHKFGEAGDGETAHFNESGIVYVNGTPYLLTVMTKGKRNTDLPLVVSAISKKVFEMMATA